MLFPIGRTGGRRPRPTERRLNRVVADMRRARALSANTLRLYLELGAFMKGPQQPRQRCTRRARGAARRGGAAPHLPRPDGHIVWRAQLAWYDALPEQARWAVQARFWRSAGRVAKRSPAVLVYELTSEPVIADAEDWYCEEMDGYAFVQRTVRQVAGRDGSALARRWIRLLKGAISTHDRRHLIGLGMLPFKGPFGPQTWPTSSMCCSCTSTPRTGGRPRPSGSFESLPRTASRSSWGDRSAWGARRPEARS
jgi:hypothetical protein